MILSRVSALADTPAVVLRAMFISSPVAPGERCTFRTGQNPPPRITAAVISLPDIVYIGVCQDKWHKQSEQVHRHLAPFVRTLLFMCTLLVMYSDIALTTLQLLALVLPTLLSHHHFYDPCHDVCLLHPQERHPFRFPLPNTCA